MTSTVTQDTSRRLTVRDLITVGIFSAFYIVVFYAAGMLGIIPIFMVVLPLMLPIVTGIPFMLYLTRIKKFGMITITGVLVSLVMMGGGHSWYILVIGPACGVAADVILWTGKYASWKHSIVAFFVFSLWVFGPMLPLLVAQQAYLEQVSQTYGTEYTQALSVLMPSWYWITIPIQVAIGALIGAWIGRATLRKHFTRAGIA